MEKRKSARERVPSEWGHGTHQLLIQKLCKGDRIGLGVGGHGW